MNVEASSGRRIPSLRLGPAFLDSNVLVYLFDAPDSPKRLVASSLVERAIRSRDACISYQVVQEVLNTLIRERAASSAQLTRLLHEVLMPLWQVMPSESLHERALGLHDRYQYHYYDSLILASALEAGCSTLLTEDMQHRQRIEGLVITNPFAA